jgi:hypothetical protein
MIIVMMVTQPQLVTCYAFYLLLIDALLASLRHAELSPREKFAYPTTSNHEYGWQHDAVAHEDATDMERNHRGKRLCPITAYAKGNTRNIALYIRIILFV